MSRTIGQENDTECVISAVALNIHIYICTGNLCCTTACPRHFLNSGFLRERDISYGHRSHHDLQETVFCIPPIPLQDCGRKTEFQFYNQLLSAGTTMLG